MRAQKRLAAARRCLAGLLIGGCLTGLLYPPVRAAEPAAEEPATTEPAAVPTDALPDYATYRSAHPGGAAAAIRLAGGDAESCDGAEAVAADQLDGVTDALTYSSETGYIRWQFTVAEAGYYELQATYYPLKKKPKEIEIGVQIDGAYPYEELRRAVLPRIWGNDTAEMPTDGSGNEYAPRQVELARWNREYLKSADGAVDGYLGVYLTAGDHTLSLYSIEEPFALAELKLCPPAVTPDYAVYAAAHADTSVGDAQLRLEAEQAHRKSDRTLRPVGDRSNPLNSPYDGGRTVMNVISGDNWRTPHQWIEWSFTVHAEGWYALGFRYQQNQLKGLFTTRRLYLDGVIPYQEAANLRFPYRNDWDGLRPLDAAGAPLRLYLTAGEHTLRLEAVAGDLYDVTARLDSVVSELNTVYRHIRMITGATVDPYRDYNLFSEVKGLRETMASCSAGLKACLTEIRRITDSSAAEAHILQTLAIQLDSMQQNEDSIPGRLSSLQGNISALAAWTLDIRNQPLDLDYLLLSGQDAAIPAMRSGFFQKVAHEARIFLHSFTSDYAVSSQAETRETLTIWVSMSRDRAQALQQLISNSFTPYSGIGVDLKLVSASVIEAILSGNAPDLAVQLTRGQPVNLAIRGALARLDGLEGYADVARQFMPDAIKPYTFAGHTYALPDSESFFMLFYRSDILEELGLAVPETWDDLIACMSVIQRNNLEVGLPYAFVNSTDEGMGANNLFSALLLQAKGSFYNAELSRTALGSTIARDVFARWTRFYSEYGAPYTYDFFNRFRSGEMPLALANYTTAAQILAAAPEITGQWGMAGIPGTRSGGTIDRTQAGNGTGCVILEGSPKKAAAWEFLKWWTSSETQVQYDYEMEAIQGVLGRIAPSNVLALDQLPWNSEQGAAILEQWRQVTEIPETIGGYYYARGLDNAFKEAVLEGRNPYEALEVWNKEINDELIRKRREFGLD